jgi:gluconolactonase
MLLIGGALGCAASPSGSNPPVNPGPVVGGAGAQSLGTGGSSVVPSMSGGAGRAGVPAGGSGGIGGTAGSQARGSGGTVAQAGAGGAAGTMMGGSGMTGGAGAAGQGGPYPMLDGNMIGMPTSISSGHTLAESPLWDPCMHKLMFVDVQGGPGQAGSIELLDPAGGQSTILAMNTGHGNGIAFDIDGTLIIAQMDGHIARRDKSGTIKAIEPAGGPMLHTPDDVVVRSDGTIYFSDGDFAPVDPVGFGPVGPIYSLKPGGTMLVNGGTVNGPNGIELSPDEKTLYVDGYSESSVWAFSVATDGTVTKGASPLATGLTSADSLCLDAAGNLYVGTSTGLAVLRPNGSMVKVIPVTTGRATTNCTFGGDDGKTLYITAWTNVLKVDNMPIPGLDWVVSAKRVKCN